jgi:hypothetical protein
MLSLESPGLAIRPRSMRELEIWGWWLFSVVVAAFRFGVLIVGWVAMVNCPGRGDRDDLSCVDGLTLIRRLTNHEAMEVRSYLEPDHAEDAGTTGSHGWTPRRQISSHLGHYGSREPCSTVEQMLH